MLAWGLLNPPAESILKLKRMSSKLNPVPTSVLKQTRRMFFPSGDAITRHVYYICTATKTLSGAAHLAETKLPIERLTGYEYFLSYESKK